jgi:RES domain-containing protein
MAEMAFRLGLNNPIPRRPVKVHSPRFDSESVLTLSKKCLETLGVDFESFDRLEYLLTQKIGLSAFQIGATALQVPSARWPSDNLVILDETTSRNSVELISSEEVNWIEWAQKFAPKLLSAE